MTKEERIAQRWRTGAGRMASEHLSEWCDVSREIGDVQDEAGAHDKKPLKVLSCLRCGVVTLTEPVEVQLGGKIVGRASVAIFLPAGTKVLPGDTLRVREHRLLSPGEVERYYEALTPDENDSVRHLLRVYGSRRDEAGRKGR